MCAPSPSATNAKRAQGATCASRDTQSTLLLSCVMRHRAASDIAHSVMGLSVSSVVMVMLRALMVQLAMQSARTLTATAVPTPIHVPDVSLATSITLTLNSVSTTVAVPQYLTASSVPRQPNALNA